MARLELPPEDAMTPEQKAAVAEVVAGIRGRVPAPMVAWLRSPELASRAQKLGEFLRYGTTLEPKLSEMAILVCGRHWTSHHEWTAHKREALKAGLEPEVIAAIAARRRPALADARESAVYEVSTTLLSTGRVPRALHDSATAALGGQGLVELVGILGYYCLVSLTLNAFELGLPGSIAPELEDPAPMG
ncbi:carboxymuconolactone decarboxylase family protein [Falsiroseomonas sp. CW058]|uniref:carboxymuconolactone decarboxylase family protein n=1 Tax=Falsiroseomonas sp. CW058 TaxID=3388664 RepID=UPI003D31D4F0